MKIENKDQDTQYFFPENLKDIKKLVKMAKEVNSYNSLLEQYLKVYKNDFLETIEWLSSKNDLSNKDEWGTSVLDRLMLKYYKNSPKDSILMID